MGVAETLTVISWSRFRTNRFAGKPSAERVNLHSSIAGQESASRRGIELIRFMSQYTACARRSQRVIGQAPLPDVLVIVLG